MEGAAVVGSSWLSMEAHLGIPIDEPILYKHMRATFDEVLGYLTVLVKGLW